MKKLYLFKELNYYIGEGLTEEMKARGVVFETEVIEGKQSKIIHDENGVSVEWVDELESEGLL
jgi:hypothetical protein